MVIVEVGSISGWFSSGPLQRELESFEKVPQALSHVVSTAGNRARLPGENLQRTSFPTPRASHVPWGCRVRWITSLRSPDPFSILLHSALSPCGLCHYMDQALLPVLCWFASANGRYWQEFGGQGQSEVEGFILQVPSLPGQPGLPNSTRRWLLPLRPSGFCLFTGLFFALPALGVVPAPCSYLH